MNMLDTSHKRWITVVLPLLFCFLLWPLSGRALSVTQRPASLGPTSDLSNQAFASLPQIAADSLHLQRYWRIQNSSILPYTCRGLSFTLPSRHNKRENAAGRLKAPPVIEPRQQPKIDRSIDLTKVEEKHIVVALFFRPDYEPTGLDDLKKFHWSINLVPKNPEGTVAAFDVSNSIEITRGWQDNPEDRTRNLTRSPRNPDQPGFAFQFRYGINPENNPMIAGRIQIGSTTTSIQDIHTILEGVELPSCDNKSCVDWAKRAIERLQKMEKVRIFDLGTFFEEALKFGANTELKASLDFADARRRMLTSAKYDVDTQKLVDISIPTIDIAPPGGPSQLADKGTPGTYTQITNGKQAELAQTAEKASEAELRTIRGARSKFVELASQHHLRPVGTGSRRLSMSTLFDMYSPKLKISLKKAAIGSVLGLGPYLWEVHDTFSRSNTSLTERTAALTSIVPLLGCATQQAVLEEQDDILGPDASDAASCLVADLLLFTPLMPFGFMTHLLRLFRSRELRFDSVEESQRVRDDAWQRRLGHFNMHLRNAAGSHWDAEIAIILTKVAKTQALVDEAWQAPAPGLEETSVRDAAATIHQVEDRITAAKCQQIADRHAELGTTLPDKMARHLAKQARDFNELFISKVNTTMRRALSSDTTSRTGMEGVFSHRLDAGFRQTQYLAKNERKISEIVDTLGHRPLSIPSGEEITTKVREILDHRWHRDPCQPNAQLGLQAIKKDYNRLRDEARFRLGLIP